MGVYVFSSLRQPQIASCYQVCLGILFFITVAYRGV
uniref:Uncharacterized protein n=1 Tax=Anguilla anguilla TaxID=7936 RepID=A0A0E9VQ86_ANGAN